MSQLKDRVAVVTGATAGIGERTAQRLVEAGARCVVTGRATDRGQALAAVLGGGAVFVPGDLTDRIARQTVIRRATETWGRLDILVNNAGLDHTAPLLDTPLEDAKRVFDVNFFAALAMLQLASSAMTGGGAIVNVTSRLAAVGVPEMGVYGASKGALLSLTRAAAAELAPRRIRVNAVAPGMTRTPLYEAWRSGQADPDAAERAVLAGIPQRRLADPDDVAAAIVFLASDAAAHITGASLPVDGGYTAV